MSEPLEISSRIERVDVYRGQALVTRLAELPPAREGGRRRVRLTDLPLRLVDDSVRVALRAPPPGVRAVELGLEWSLPSPGAPVRTDLDELISALERERIGRDLERQRWHERLGFLRELGPSEIAASELPDALAFSPRRPVEVGLRLASFVREASERAWSEVRRLEHEHRDLSERMAALELERAQQSGAEVASLAACRKAACLTLELPASVGCTLELSYLVPLARWAPEYELRVAEDLVRAELVLKALVAQRTGEDWDGVGLSFSTADLTRSSELPELDSWRLGKAQPARASGWRPLPEGLDELFAGFDAGRRSLPAPPRMDEPRLPRLERLGGEVRAKGAQPRAGIDLSALSSAVSGAVSGALPPSPPSVQPQPARRPSPPPAPKPEPEPEPECDAMPCCEEVADMDFESGARAPMPPPAAVMRSAMAPGGMPRAGGAAKKSARRREAAKEMVGRSIQLEAEQEDGAAPEGDEETPGLEASREALVFESLRLAGPEDPQRGHLRAVSALERLGEALGASLPRGAARELGRALVAPERQALDRLALPAHARGAERTDGHFSVRYPLEGASRVTSDGQFHGLSLLRREGEVRRVYRTLPMLDEQVYLVVEFQNPLELPLLAGPVRVYRGGDFLVTAPLEVTPPGKALTVNLGVEPAIKVARNVSFQESSGGLFGGDAVLEHRVHIEVRSRLAVPAEVEVFERVPTSHEDGVKVEVLEATPAPAKYEQRERNAPIEGGRRFRLSLAPGATGTCSLVYRIVIPTKRVIEGGNRRV